VPVASGQTGDRHAVTPPGSEQAIHWISMTFEREMDQFFMRNCYFDKDRERVRATPAYRQAEAQEDITQAQEVATRVLEAK
jgi:hypothetical protein